MTNIVKVFEDNAGSLHVVVKGLYWAAIIATLSAEEALEIVTDDEIGSCNENYIAEPFLSTAAGDDVDSTIKYMEDNHALIWYNYGIFEERTGVSGERFLRLYVEAVDIRNKKYRQLQEESGK